MKHADALEAEVEFNYTEDVLLFSVRDDGTGFVATPGAEAGREQSAGRGLRDIRERAEVIGAEFVISSNSDDGGSKISLRIPYRNTGDLE